jgi:hypothetical protein
MSLAMLAVAAIVALSGCIKLDMQMNIQSDDTVDGTIILAVARDQAELFGGEDALRESIQGESEGLFSDAPDTGEFDQRDYEDDEWIGTESEFSGVPIDEFAGAEDGTLTITRDGDEFVVDGEMDLTEGTDDPSADALLASSELDVSISFPGDVIEANGEIDGNEVSWEPSPGEVLEISARGSAEAGMPWMTIAAVGALVALVVIGVVLLIVMRGRQTAADAPGTAGPTLDGPVTDGPPLPLTPPPSPGAPSPPEPPSAPSPPAPPAGP